jgi:hypothetical protein
MEDQPETADVVADEERTEADESETENDEVETESDEEETEVSDAQEDEEVEENEGRCLFLILSTWWGKEWSLRTNLFFSYA